MTQWRQRDAAKDSMQQQTDEKSFERGQNTKTTRDCAAEIKQEDAMRELERTESAPARKVWVYVTGRGRPKEEARRIAEGAASVIMELRPLIRRWAMLYAFSGPAALIRILAALLGRYDRKTSSTSTI
jgi:hypothetical protein